MRKTELKIKFQVKVEELLPANSRYALPEYFVLYMNATSSSSFNDPVRKIKTKITWIEVRVIGD